MSTAHELIQAHYHNVAHNQIGGETDGVSPEVMADLGFETAQQTLDIIKNLGSVAEREDVAVYCADCGQKLPCGHAGNGRTYGY